MLREFGQNNLQSLLMRLAGKENVKRAAVRLLPLVTLQDCRESPMHKHWLNARAGFRRLYMREAGKC